MGDDRRSKRGSKKLLKLLCIGVVICCLIGFTVWQISNGPPSKRHEKNHSKDSVGHNRKYGYQDSQSTSSSSSSSSSDSFSSSSSSSKQNGHNGRDKHDKNPPYYKNWQHGNGREERHPGGSWNKGPDSKDPKKETPSNYEHPSPSPSPKHSPVEDDGDYFDENDVVDEWPQVIIGGGGYAGIAFAERLAARGIQYKIFEARDRLGGRMKSVEFGNNPETDEPYNVAVGANWVQGLDGNPVWAEKKKYGLRGNRQDFDDALIYDRNGVYNEDETNYEDGTNCERADTAYVGAGRISARCLQPFEDDGPIVNPDKRFCRGLNNKMIDIGFDDYGDDDDRSSEEGQRGWQNRFFVPTEDDDALAALCEYYSQDFEWAQNVKVTSLNNTLPINTYNDFKDADFWVGGPRSRGYEWLVESKAAEFIATSVNNNRRKVFDDPEHLEFNTKITHVRWVKDANDDDDSSSDSDDDWGESSESSGGGKKKPKVFVTVCETYEHKQKNRPTRYLCVPGTDRTFKADYFISTFSLGVLKETLKEEQSGNSVSQSRDVAPRFTPKLSSVNSLKNALADYPMAQYSKIFFQFKSEENGGPGNFWDDSQLVLSAYSQGQWTGTFAPVWQSLDVPSLPNKFLPGSKIFFVTVTGDRALELHAPSVTDNNIIAEILPVLNQMYGAEIQNRLGRLLKKSDIEHFEMERWVQDELYRGMYSNMAANVSWTDIEPSRQLHGNLMFSGEHSCFRYNGYVHGALLGGQRSARILLQEAYGFADEFEHSICDLVPNDVNDDGVAIFNPDLEESLVTPESAETIAAEEAEDDNLSFGTLKTKKSGSRNKPNGEDYMVHSRGYRRKFRPDV